MSYLVSAIKAARCTFVFFAQLSFWTFCKLVNDDSVVSANYRDYSVFSIIIVAKSRTSSTGI